MRLAACFLAFSFALAPAAQADELVLDVSQERVAVTTWFTGSRILIFGAVKDRDELESPSLDDVLVTVRGPSESVSIHQKTREFGLWINTRSAEITDVPSFFAAAATGDVRSIADTIGDRADEVDIRRAIDDTSGAAFADAVVRLKTGERLYTVKDASVRFLDETLFRTSIALPAAIQEGNYEVRAHLVRDGEVVGQTQTIIFVRRAGLEKWLYDLADEQRIAYGLMSLAIAIFAGWIASAVFRLFPRKT